jgi:hypothetical protein
MNGFQIGSKRLKVQHKRTGLEDDARVFGQVQASAQFGSFNDIAVDGGAFHGSGHQLTSLAVSASGIQDSHQLRGQRRNIVPGNVFVSTAESDQY